MIRTTLITIVMLAACHRNDSQDAPPVVTGPPRLASATQADLGRDVDDADRRGTWSDVRHRWEGQPLRWTVTRQRLLCRSADDCHVAPFTIQRPATHGWLPALTFAGGEFAKIETGCGSAEQCTLEIEGTLRELSVSGDLPTSLRITGVHVVSARRA